jgi:signal peptidase II
MAVAQQKRPWLWGPLSAFGTWVALLVVALDQGHKWWMLDVYRIQDKGRVRLTPFFDLVFVKNTGISYGLFLQDTRQGQWLLAGFSCLAVLAMAVWLARVGNAIDRLRLDGVADFFSLHAFGFYWYVFNIADAAIVAGVIGLIYDSFGPSRNDASKAV